MKYRIPYNELAIVGLSKEMVDSMPDEFKEKLQNGEFTQLVILSKSNKDRRIDEPVKMQMQLTPDGKSQQLVLYPMNAEPYNTHGLKIEDFEALKKGSVIKLGADKYLQLEPETNVIIEKNSKQLDLDKKISELEKVKDIELGMEQKNQMREGKPVELNVGGEKVTVGLDLKAKEGFVSLNGDMNEWKRQQEIIYDILHPEYVGLVQTDENRWEQHIVKKEGLQTATLKERPAQTKSASMHL